MYVYSELSRVPQATQLTTTAFTTELLVELTGSSEHCTIAQWLSSQDALQTHFNAHTLVNKYV